jgi:general secretion pathway protein E
MSELFEQDKRITVENLSALLIHCKLINEKQRKEIQVKQGKQKARLLIEQKELRFSRGRAQIVMDISPAQIIASFKLPLPDDPDRIITEDLIMEKVAEEMGMEYVKIDPLKLDLDMVTRTISRAFARKHSMIPIAAEDHSLLVATDDPFDLEGVDGIKHASGKQVRLVLSSRSDIQRIINDFYGFRISVTAAERELAPSFDIGNLEQYVKMRQEDQIDYQDQPIINAVEYLFRYAYSQRASDIHIEPKRDYSAIRFRIDGVLHDIHRIPKVIHSAVVSRVKILSRMDIAEKRKPQDGRIKTEHKGAEIELRVSTMPVAFGEKVVIRIFDPTLLMQDLENLGFFPREIELFDHFITRTHGIILVTGPTGSGKTTTLYSALKKIASPMVNIVTIEDPIEMVYEEFNQVSVQPKVDVTFANALRTILRQDPDIIMVGEIRDKETASYAIQAALTGHLVLSTLHTNDTASSITRLLDLGIEPFLISSTVIGVMAQRLVRKICPHCKKETVLTEDDLKMLGIPLKDRAKTYKVWYGEGCVECRNTGYLGRTSLFEVMEMSEKVKKLTNQRAPGSEIKKTAVDEGMMILREIAIRKLGMGITTVEEVLRVTAEE